MPCNCGKGKAKREKFEVVLKGGTVVSKTSEAAAKSFSAANPGSTVRKVA